MWGINMPSEKEKSVLKSKDYKINGNDLRGFYDAHGKLVFVLDFTVDEIKPNVLLVMSSRGNRKWDDILSNDYGMDLELVRPKKDNKYQKLDIEYDGLVVYDNLIRAYTDKGDVKKAVKDLENFRASSSRRSANERLSMASAVAENARETIERTGDTIVELQAKIKAARSKITSLRRNVGREPTKQSAAKILKAEAQLEALNSKLARAKKRLENANKRLLVAEDDMAAARKVLDLIPESKGKEKVESLDTLPVAVPVDVVATQQEQNEPISNDESGDELDETPEEESYSDEEEYNDSGVKPLFDKDPNILDDKIAFKPISFNDSITNGDEVEDVQDTKENEHTLAPEQDVKETEDNSGDAISFTPPKAIMDVVQVPGDNADDEDVRFDDVFAENVDEDVVYDTNAQHVEETEKVEEPDSVLSSLQSVDLANTENILEKDDKVTEIVAPENTGSPLVDDVVIQDNQSVVEPEAVVSDTKPIVRPVSPVRPTVINTPGAKIDTPQHKPSLLYYVLLLVLIALSVFTLWLYQRSNVSVDAVPELSSAAIDNVAVATTEQPVVATTSASVPESVNVVAEDVKEDDTNPFVASAEEVNHESNDGVMGEFVENSLNKIAKAAETQNVSVDGNPAKTDEVVQEPEVSVAPVVNKPEYNVSQEKVFTSDEPDVVGGSLCDGDIAPDANGCCPGETYSVVDGQNVCCPDDGGDCFPPMF